MAQRETHIHAYIVSIVVEGTSKQTVALLKDDQR